MTSRLGGGPLGLLVSFSTVALSVTSLPTLIVSIDGITDTPSTLLGSGVGGAGCRVVTSHPVAFVAVKTKASRSRRHARDSIRGQQSIRTSIPA